MQRVYFLMDNEAACDAAEATLIANKVNENRIYIFDNLEDEMVALPEAHVWKKRSFPPFVKGGMAGAVAGSVAALAAVLVPPAGVPIDWHQAVFMIAVGTIMGSIMIGMASHGEHVKRLKKFEDAVREDEWLLVVDMPPGEEKRLRNLVLTRHAARYLGTVPLGKLDKKKTQSKASGDK